MAIFAHMFFILAFYMFATGNCIIFGTQSNSRPNLDRTWHSESQDGEWVQGDSWCMSGFRMVRITQCPHPLLNATCENSMCFRRNKCCDLYDANIVQCGNVTVTTYAKCKCGSCDIRDLPIRIHRH